MNWKCILCLFGFHQWSEPWEVNYPAWTATISDEFGTVVSCRRMPSEHYIKKTCLNCRKLWIREVVAYENIQR